MQRVQLGKTGIKISKIGLGVWQFAAGTGGYWKVLEPGVINGICKTALDRGINWFDTAEIYGKGSSERNLARGLKSAGVKPGEVAIADKWWAMARSAHSIRETIDERLKNLKGYEIDLYQIHWPNSVVSIQAQMNAMADLVDAGKIRSAGVSNFSARQMHEAHQVMQKRGHVLASNQVPYSLLDRRIEASGVLDNARELGITVIAYSPLAQGLLTGRFHADPGKVRELSFARRARGAYSRKRLKRTRPVIDALKEIADRHAATPAQVALNWLLSFHEDAVVAIPGASRAAHVADNAGALNFTLSSDELERLDELTRQYL